MHDLCTRGNLFANARTSANAREHFQASATFCAGVKVVSRMSDLLRTPESLFAPTQTSAYASKSLRMNDILRTRTSLFAHARPSTHARKSFGVSADFCACPEIFSRMRDLLLMRRRLRACASFCARACLRAYATFRTRAKFCAHARIRSKHLNRRISENVSATRTRYRTYRNAVRKYV